jgi:hypothetical protein
MDEIRFNDEHSIEAFKKAMFPRFYNKLDVAIARYRNGELMGGVVLTNYYRHHSISIYVYSWNKRWINRDMLFVVFNYVFNQLKVKHLFADSKESQTSFDLNIGFKVVARIDDFYPDDAKVFLRMDREDCRFLDIKPRHIGRTMH